MANMSYCRFHNTQMDLSDCLEAIQNREISNEEEKRKAKRMLNEFLNFCLDEGIIEDFDGEKVDEIIQECNE